MNKNEYLKKEIYFAHYIGQQAGSISGGRFSCRRIAWIANETVYFSNHPGNWGHISNFFLWLKHIDDLTDPEVSELMAILYPLIYPADCNIDEAKKVLTAIVYRTTPYDLYDDDEYSIDLHLNLIRMGVAVPYMDGTTNKISIPELTKMQYIASRDQINAFNAEYAKLSPDGSYNLWNKI